MAKLNETHYIVKSLLRDMLTKASRMHKASQAANKAGQDNDIDKMNENIDLFMPLLKEMQGICAAITKQLAPQAEGTAAA